MPRAIQRSSELDRVLNLPSRGLAISDEIVSACTTELRTIGGTLDLWNIQAAALIDFFRNRGLLAPIKVSGGKTLISLLAPTVIESRRPLLLLPAKLIKKTKRAIQTLSHHFRIPNYIRIESYELLGRVQAEDLLKKYQPDLIIADECHKLKNRKASVTRRVQRYMQENRNVIFCGLSGTISRRSIKDYAHLHLWAARHSGQYCLPFSYHDLDDWSRVLDTKPPSDGQRIEPGALLLLATEDDFDPDPFVTARRGYGRRLSSTQGVVISSGAAEDLGCSLVISDLLVPDEIDGEPLDQQSIDAKIEAVRRTWCTPEGYALSFAPQVWQHVQQMALGFYYRYKPRPPEEWFEARKTWAAFVRAMIEAPNSKLDSELRVAQEYPDAPELEAWRYWRAAHPVQKEAVWFNDSVLRFCANWLKTHERGLLWTSYIEFGQALSQLSGVPYFQENASDPSGKYLPDHEGPAICSVIACSEGLDLQYRWDQSLIASPFASPLLLEQIAGRTHRFGQEADQVTIELLVNCIEHANAIQTCLNEAEQIKNRELLENKILYCDLSIDYDPFTLASYHGGRWH